MFRPGERFIRDEKLCKERKLVNMKLDQYKQEFITKLSETGL